MELLRASCEARSLHLPLRGTSQEASPQRVGPTASVVGWRRVLAVRLDSGGSRATVRSDSAAHERLAARPYLALFSGCAGEHRVGPGSACPRRTVSCLTRRARPVKELARHRSSRAFILAPFRKRGTLHQGGTMRGLPALAAGAGPGSVDGGKAFSTRRRANGMRAPVSPPRSARALAAASRAWVASPARSR